MLAARRARVVASRDPQRWQEGGNPQRERWRSQGGGVDGWKDRGGARQRHQAEVEAQEDIPIELTPVGRALSARLVAEQRGW